MSRGPLSTIGATQVISAWLSDLIIHLVSSGWLYTQIDWALSSLKRDKWVATTGIKLTQA